MACVAENSGDVNLTEVFKYHPQAYCCKEASRKSEMYFGPYLFLVPLGKKQIAHSIISRLLWYHLELNSSRVHDAINNSTVCQDINVTEK